MSKSQVKRLVAQGASEVLIRQIEALQSENKRLREALEKIVDTDIFGDKPCRKIAWEALSKRET